LGKNLDYLNNRRSCSTLIKNNLSPYPFPFKGRGRSLLPETILLGKRGKLEGSIALLLLKTLSIRGMEIVE
jgi:hypothetical protein